MAPLLKEFEAMKRSRFTEVQVAYALRQAEAGMSISNVSTGYIAWKVFKSVCGYAERSV